MDDLFRLQSALKDNLEIRGVMQQLRAALLAEISGTLRNGKVDSGAKLKHSPDAVLTRAIVAEYLQSSGLFATLAVFQAETGCDIGPKIKPTTEDSSTTSTSTSRSSPTSTTTTAENSTTHTFHSSTPPAIASLNRIGAVVAKSIAEELALEAAGESARSLLQSGFTEDDDEYSIMKSSSNNNNNSPATTTATPPKASSIDQRRQQRRRYAGFLDPQVVALELGIDTSLIENEDTTTTSHHHQHQNTSSTFATLDLPGSSPLGGDTHTPQSTNTTYPSKNKSTLSSPSSLLERLITTTRRNNAGIGAAHRSWVRYEQQQQQQPFQNSRSATTKSVALLAHDPSTFTLSLAPVIEFNSMSNTSIVSGKGRRSANRSSSSIPEPFYVRLEKNGTQSCLPPPITIAL